MYKKGQITGLVTGLVIGVASLIVAIIIAFVIVGTLAGSNIIPQTVYYVVNESQLNGPLVSANQSGYKINGSNQLGANGFIIDAVWSEYNQSNGSAINVPAGFGGYNVSLAAVNYSLNVNGSSNLSSGKPLTTNFPNVSVSYHYTGDNSQNIVAKNMTSNFSGGVQNISKQIPTILLIAAIILILGVLAVLIVLWQKMRGAGSGL